MALSVPLLMPLSARVLPRVLVRELQARRRMLRQVVLMRALARVVLLP